MLKFFSSNADNVLLKPTKIFVFRFTFVVLFLGWVELIVRLTVASITVVSLELVSLKPMNFKKASSLFSGLGMRPQFIEMSIIKK